MNAATVSLPKVRLTIATVVIALLAGCTSSAPGSSATGEPARASSPVTASTVPATPHPTLSPTPIPKPVDSTVDGVTVRTLSLGDNAAPIDVAIAFGSIWVANHHANSVTRLDPESMAVQASIPAGSGPGWIVVTDDAVWVSDQNDVGLKRIDPETNTAPTKAGKWPPCGDGVLAFGSIWQPACDAKRILRIDPTTFATTDINAPAQFWALLVRDRLITAGPNGLATLDPKTNAFTPIGGQDPGRMMAFDGTTIWSSDEQQVLRIRPNDGSVMATLPIPEAGTVAFVDRRAWVTSSTGLVEVDPVKNAIVRTLPIGRSVSVAAGGGSLWVTSYDANTLTRVRP